MKPMAFAKRYSLICGLCLFAASCGGGGGGGISLDDREDPPNPAETRIELQSLRVQVESLGNALLVGTPAAGGGLIGGGDNTLNELDDLRRQIADSLSALEDALGPEDSVNVETINARLGDLGNLVRDITSKVGDLVKKVEDLCPDDSPVLDNRTTNISGVQSPVYTGCRPPLREVDCKKDTMPIYENGKCRARKAQDCTGGTPIFDGGDCRALAARDCAATEEFEGGTCRDRIASDCTGGTPVLGDNKQCRARIADDCTGAAPVLDGGNCRARIAADCGGAEPVFDSGNCRARVADDCTGRTPVFENGNCRTLIAADCGGDTPIFENGNCRTRTANDCTGGTPVLGDNRECRARIADDCTGAAPVLDGGNCRARLAADCTGGTPVFDHGNCRARVAADCIGAEPVLDNGNCRARIAADCTGGLEFVSGICRTAVVTVTVTAPPVCEGDKLIRTDDGNGCRAVVASDCGGLKPVFRGGKCTPREAADCLAYEIFDNGDCRTRKANDCTGRTPVLGNDGECRARTSSDCPHDAPVLDNGICRTRGPADCTGALIFDRGICRAVVASDCTGATPLFRHGKCNPRDAKSCFKFEVFENGNCRTRTVADCAGTDMPILTKGGVCRAIRKRDCNGATPVFENNACRARVAADCENTNKPIFDDGYCRKEKKSDCTAEEIYRGGACIVRTALHCTGDTPVLSADGTSCRARIAADCTGGTPVLGDHGECRARVADDCPDRTPVLDGGNCRARIAADCAAGTVFDNGECVFSRVRVAARRLADLSAPAESSCPDTHVRVGIECYERSSVNNILDSEREARVAHCRRNYNREDRDYNACELIVDNSISQTKLAIANNCRIDMYYLTDLSAAHNKPKCLLYSDWHGIWSRDTTNTRPYIRAWEEGVYVRFQQDRAIAENSMKRCPDGSVLPAREECGEFRTAEYGRNYGLRIMNTEYAYRQGAFGQSVTVAVINPGGTQEINIITAPRDGRGMHGVAPEAKINIIAGDDRTPDGALSVFTDAVNSNAKIILGHGRLGRDSRRSTYFTGSFRGENYRILVPGNHPIAWNAGDFNRAAAVAALAKNADFVAVDSLNSIRGRDFIHRDGNMNICRDRGQRSCTRRKSHEFVAGTEYFGFTYDEFAAEFMITVNGTVSALADLHIPIPPDNETNPDVFHGFYTDVHPELEDHWLLVGSVTHDRFKDRWGRSFIQNICGSAKNYCVVAPSNVNGREDNFPNYPIWASGNGGPHGLFSDSQNSYYAAGALALLQSAAPEMPMTEIRKVLLTTATDLGAPGIDADYGWGLINIEAGIKHIQNNIRTSSLGGQFTPLALNSLRAPLPASLSHLKERLHNIKVAVKVTDNSYYNMPLSDIVGETAQKADIGGLASDMLSDTNGNGKRRYFGFNAAQKSAAPFFANSDSAFVLEFPGDGFRPFAAVDNGAENLFESDYRQFGFRWRKSGEGFGFRAEVSRIDERGGFMGGEYGPLGASSGTETAQGRIFFGGKLSEAWEGFAEYEHARMESGAESGGYLQNIDGAADGWSAGLQRRDIFAGGDKLRFSVRQETGLTGGTAHFRYPQAEGDSHAAFMGDSSQSLLVGESSVGLGGVPQVIYGIGYAFRPWAHAEISFGGEYEKTTGSGAVSAALRWNF